MPQKGDVDWAQFLRCVASRERRAALFLWGKNPRSASRSWPDLTKDQWKALNKKSEKITDWIAPLTRVGRTHGDLQEEGWRKPTPYPPLRSPSGRRNSLGFSICWGGFVCRRSNDNNNERFRPKGWILKSFQARLFLWGDRSLSRTLKSNISTSCRFHRDIINRKEITYPLIARFS